MGNTKSGIHILADFFLCKEGKQLMLESKKLEEFVVKTITQSQLNIVGNLFYQFPNAGVTGVVLLAESHFTIHTWPEKRYLTLDIFVCNLSQDNTVKANNVYNLLYQKFLPEKVNKQEIIRE